MWLFLALALGISWSAYLVSRLTDPTFDQVLRLVVKFGPSIAGLAAAGWIAGAKGALSILKRLVPRARDAKWIAFALVNRFVWHGFLESDTSGRLMRDAPCVDVNRIDSRHSRTGHGIDAASPIERSLRG